MKNYEIENENDFFKNASFENFTKLRIAALSEDRKKMAALIQKGGDVNATNILDKTPLIIKVQQPQKIANQSATNGAQLESRQRD